MPMMRSPWRIVLLLALAPALGGFKCIDYVPPEAAPEDAGPTDDATSTPVPEDGEALDGAVGDGGFVPAVACAQAGMARLIIENYEYRIMCGCAEATGPTCSVPVGTVVVWTFADSEEHNVASVANAFGMSALMLAGQFSHTFATTGTYGYGCTIHSAAMSGYRIVSE